MVEDTGKAGVRITEEVVDAAASVILQDCGEERSTYSWARRVAEDAILYPFIPHTHP